MNPEKLPEVNYQEAQWQIDNNIVNPQYNLHILSWEAEFGGYLVDIPNIYTDPNAIDFDKSHTEGPITVFVPSSHFQDSSDGQNRDTWPISDPSIVFSSNRKSQSQSQDVQTPTDIRQKDSSTRASEPKTNIETAYEPMQQSQSRQSDNPSTIEINAPTTENIP